MARTGAGWATSQASSPALSTIWSGVAVWPLSGWNRAAGSNILLWLSKGAGMARVFARAILIAATMAAPAAAAAPVYKYSYTYPAQARAIDSLRSWLEADKARGQKRFAAQAVAAQRAAKKDGFPYRMYDATRTWKIVANTPRFLSL